MAPPDAFESWLRPDSFGLCCMPGGFHIDPSRAVARAVITHAHSDHARPGHGAVLATRETIAAMQARLGGGAPAASRSCLRRGDRGGRGRRQAGAGGAYPRQRAGGARSPWRPGGDLGRLQAPPRSYGAPFELVRCDLFVTEATFGLPVFRHEPDEREIGRLLASLAAFRRPHARDRRLQPRQVPARDRAAAAGRLRPAHLAARRTAGDVRSLRALGVDLGPLALVSDAPDKLAGEIVLCPPSALKDRWSRRLTDPVTAYASGWMRVRGRARQDGVELPLVISDHVDWPELIATIEETGCGRDLGDARSGGGAGASDRADGTQRAGAGAGRASRRRRIEAFAELLDRLAYTPGRNAKLRLMRRYFQTTPDPDRGYALAALTDGLPFSFPVRRTITW